MNLIPFRNKVDLAGAFVLAISLFGFLGNVMIDYNWGTNFVASSFALFYWMTLRWMVPFPIGYWGVGALFYFALFLLSFAILNRRESSVKNVLETIRLGSAAIIMFETGVFYFVPGFINKWVIDAVYGTPLASFTNWDLLATASVSAIVSNVILARLKHHSKPPRPDSGTVIS